MSTQRDIAGERFGRLVALKPNEIKERRLKWHCLCDCGEKRIVLKQNLLNGSSQSCGCRQREIAGNLLRLNTKMLNGGLVKHGHTINGRQSPEYRSWHHMKQRCLNTTNDGWKNYGGRGIKVCDRWLGKKGFDNFIADMGSRPTARHSIERINNNGHYTPSNCKWATRLEQTNNTRANLVFTLRGTTMSLADWCRHEGLPYWRVRARLKYGWTIEKALDRG